MKKLIFCVIPLLMAFTGCPSLPDITETSGGSAGMDLDAAVRAAAAQMGKNLPGERRGVSHQISG